MLVAHLGQIEISNDKKIDPISPSHLSEELSGGTHKEHFAVDVRDMSLYSLNVDEKWKSSFSHFYTGPSAFLRVTAQELYSCASPHGRPILHDTLLKFSLHRITDRPILSDADPFLFPLTDFYPKLEVCDVFQVNGCVVSPLQVSLSKAQYQQIVDSLDNLTGARWKRLVTSKLERISLHRPKIGRLRKSNSVNLSSTLSSSYPDFQWSCWTIRTGLSLVFRLKIS